MNVAEVAPDAFHAVLGIEKYSRAHVDPKLLHLIKLRASMLNGCAYCVQMHSRDALADGEPASRLFGLSAWHETDYFDERERAALALTDSVTRLAPGGVPDDVWDAAAKEFEPRELADLLVAIATINVWNRIAIPTRVPPEADAGTEA
jgi:AhpD family alkylhydroperoxidase